VRVRGGGESRAGEGPDVAGGTRREPPGTRRKGEEEGKGREREEERGSPWDPKSGDNRHQITLGTRWERERGGREGEGISTREKSNERKGEREAGAWGREGRQGRAGPGHTGLGWVRLGRVAGRKPAAHTTTDRKPIANRNPSEAKRTCD
jgi:hypothetical protein